MRKKKAPPVPARDPMVCLHCTHAHGTPGVKCDRHGKYIERHPTKEEEREALAPVEREIVAASEVTEAIAKTLEDDKLDPVFEALTDIEEAYAEVRSEREELLEDLGLNAKLVHKELLDEAKLLVERSCEYTRLCEAVGDLNPDATAYDEVLDAYDEMSSVVAELRTERGDLLEILGLSEHDWETMGYTQKSALKLRLAS